MIVCAVSVVSLVAVGLLDASASGVAGPTTLATGASDATPSVSATSTSRPPASVAPPAALVATPLVPVVSFWSASETVGRADILGLWMGSAAATSRTGYKTLAVSDAYADALGLAFEIAPSASVHRLTTDQVKTAVESSSTVLGLIPAQDVSIDVRALAVDGISLFTSDRVRTVARWPLDVLAPSPAPAAAASPTASGVASQTNFDPSGVWTLAAGGDVNLARAVYVQAVTKKLGPDYPWSAGYAVIRGRACCGYNNAPLVNVKATGQGGILRSRLSDADIALVNLEGSAPNNHVNDRDSLNFTFDPSLLVGLKDAGIDAVTLANNHIKNGGAQGVIETIQHLDAINLAHTGAGANTTAARQPVWLTAAGRKIAVLGYSAVGSGNWATATKPGAAPLHLADVTADIHAAKAAGADIVIVMPHWGEEYSYLLNATQKGDAAAFVAAGADLVIGSHSHWVGGIETLDGVNGPAFIDYSLGDFLFNLNHDVQAQEGVLVTLTFSGSKLVQVNLEPTAMIQGSRVGLLNPSTDGKAVLDAIRAASRRLPGW